MKTRLGFAAVVALMVMGTLWGSVPRASANHCTTPPLLKAVTINQGLGGYARLARGKEALVRFYLALPSTRCGSGGTAGNVTAIKINSASLAVKNGSAVLTPTGGISAQADAIGAQVVSTSIANDHPSSPKFVVPGSILAPSNTTGTWTATFEATIKYQTKNTKDTAFGPETTLVLTKTDGTTGAITKAVDRQTTALRVLAVPLGGPLSPTANAAMQNGFTAVSRLFPVPDGTPTGGRTGPITGTSGGLRYTLNAGYVDLTGLLDLNGLFCGSALNLSAIQSQLQDFRTDWDLANPDASHADRAVGFIGPENSAGAGSQACAEGYAFVNGTEAWARAVPDATQPSKTGPITALEICHTFGCVSPTAINFDGAYHSIFTNADNQQGDAERGYNVLDRRYLSDDHTATNVVDPYTNANTLMERSDWSLMQCKLGGTATTECSSPGSTGTLIGVAAGPAFAFRGRTDDTPAGTLVNSYFDAGIARTAPPTTSGYNLVQLQGVVVKRNDLIQVGPVQAHTGENEVQAAEDTFSAVVPFDLTTTRMEFWKGSPGASGSVLLWSRTRNNPPVLTSVSSTFAPGRIVQLTMNSSDDVRPALSPQGWIAWTQGNDPGDVRVAKLGFLGSAVTVDVGSSGTDDPAWHPAGNRLAFVSDSVLHTVSVNISGNTAQLGTPQAIYGDSIDGPFVSHPTYSPDGSEIAFEADGEIWKVNANGSSPTQLTTTGGVASEPSWSWEPGVQRIAYTVEDVVGLLSRSEGGSSARAGSAAAGNEGTTSSTTTTGTRGAKPAKRLRAAFSVNSILDTRDVTPQKGMCADWTAACTLRAAIQELIQALNAFAGADTIDLSNSSARSAVPLSWTPSGMTRLSVSTTDGDGNGQSGQAGVSISADGRYVAFDSAASNLIASDTNGVGDIFVRDLQTDTTDRVSVSSTGGEGNALSNVPFISADGRYVVFQSSASNLVAGDANGTLDIFLRDRLTGTTELISVSSSEIQGNSLSAYPTVSADGRYVVFDGFASNLVPSDTNSNRDIFVRDRSLGTTELVSVSSAEVQGDDFSQFAMVSADGRFATFESESTNLVSGDTAVRDVYLRDFTLGTTERMSVSTTDIAGNAASFSGAVSSDGRYVVFASQATNFDTGDVNPYDDVFLRDRVAGTTERISVSSGGTIGNFQSLTGFRNTVSDDGRYVVFDGGASNLVPGDTNGVGDVFVRDRSDSTTERVSVSASAAQSNGNSGISVMSADGGIVAFFSLASNLVSGDANGFGDVFATVEGPAGPSTLVVNSDDDANDGACNATHCSLREAINASNASVGTPETITFSIGSGPQTITPTSALPTITSPVTIDGTTQPGFTNSPIIELDGSLSGETTNAGLDITGGNSTVKGLVINRWPRAIWLRSAGNLVAGNYIGTNVAGTAALGNITGVGVTTGPNTIGGTTAADRNVISGNGNPALAETSGIGISIEGDGVIVKGNYIGTNATGSAALGNLGPGIYTTGSGTVVGGTEPGARNIISANTSPAPSGVGGEGVQLYGPNSVVQGNYIGTDVTGTVDLGNGFRGILIVTSGNQIGGTAVAARNVISGNTYTGIHVGGGSDNRIEGNYVGTNAAGTAKIGNTGFGIQINSNGNFVGGAASGAGNLISGNGSGIGNGGVVINGGSNVVQGNLIGTDAAGTGNLGNTWSGVSITANFGTPESGKQNSIGGTAAGAANVIAFNGGGPFTQPGGGVVIQGATATTNPILQNSIYLNDGGLGIDLGGDGVSANDPDPGTAPNNLQNFPVLTSATLGPSTTVSGTLNSEANQTYRIEFFASSECDSTHGEGARFLSYQSQTTDGSGNSSFTANELPPTSAGEVITATATDADGNTSEFSECLTEAAGSADLSISLGDIPDPVTSGANVTLSVGVSNTGPDASTGSTVTVDPDSRLTFVSSTNESCAPDSGLNIVCSVGSIPSDGDANFQITFDTSGSGLASTTGSVDGAEDDTNSDNDSDTVTTQINGETEDGIYVLDPDNPAAPDTKLVSNASEPALSPAGTLFFTRDGGLWVAKGDGTEETDLTTAGRWASPMGGEVAFQRFIPVGEGGQWEIFLMTQRRTITAIATDEIPANLRFLYFYDCGADTHPLGNRTGVVTSSNEATSELEFDTGGACGSGEATGTVTVIASDGIDLSVERPTTSFEVERSAPVAAIPSPQAGAGYTDDQTITLHGSAYDHEGRQLPGGNLTWTSPDGLFTGTKTGNTVVLPPAAGLLNGKEYTVIMTATDADGVLSSPVKTTIVVYTDTDQDGLTDRIETSCNMNPNDATDAFTDTPDGDGIPAIDDIHTVGDPFTSNGPCVEAPTYKAIINFDPDELNIPSSGGTATAYVEVPYRSVSQIVGSSVRISAIDGIPYTQQNIGWSIKGVQGVAKFSRAALAAELVRRQVMNRAVRITISGTVAGKPFSGDGSTFVKQG